MSKFRETYNKLLGHGQESIKKGSDLYDFCMAMLNDDSIKSMGGADFDEKVKTYMQKLGIAGAGPVPNTLLARQDLEAGKKKSMAVQKSKVEKKPTSQKGYKEDLGQLKQYHHDEALRMVRTMARSGASPEKIRADVGYGFGMQSWDVNDLMREAGILKSQVQKVTHDEIVNWLFNNARNYKSKQSLFNAVANKFKLNIHEAIDEVMDYIEDAVPPEDRGYWKGQVEKDAALDRARDYYDHGKSLEELAEEYSERFSISYQTAFRLMSQIRTETKKQMTQMEKATSVEKMKNIFREFADEYRNLSPSQIVNIILDNPQGMKAFDNYSGNEFDLRHEIENYLNSRKDKSQVKKSAQSDAQAIISIDQRIWNEMGINSGGQLNKPELWEKYKNRVSQSVTGRVKRDVWEIIEDNNYHSIILALRELGRLDMAKSQTEKGQVEQTGKQLERLADKAAEADGTDEEKSLVDRIKAVQIKRQQATIAARSKTATAKSFKDFWQQTQNHE